jgi:cytochrome c
MRHIAVLAVAAAIGWTFNALAQDAEALLKKEGCMKCHSVSAKKEGPAFKDVAAKYKGKPDGAATVQKQITSAPSHPHVKTKNEKDVKAIVDYVLSR